MHLIFWPTWHDLRENGDFEQGAQPTCPQLAVMAQMDRYAWNQVSKRLDALVALREFPNVPAPASWAAACLQVPTRELASP